MIPFLHRVAPSTMEENPLWLIVLCDMMTNLMLFFLIMFAFNLQEPEARAALAKTFRAEDVVAPPGEVQPVREVAPPDLAESLRAMMEDEGLAGAVEVEETEEAVRVRLRSKILFPSAEATLAPGSEAPFDALARLLREIPNTVIVEGHTDDVPVVSGPYESNWELSVARAHAVLSRLGLAGVPPARLVAAGYGEYRPLAPNDSPDGRSRNRRVEIAILRQEEPR